MIYDSDFIEEVAIEWAYRVPNGKPNSKNSYHLIILEDVLLEMGVDKETTADVMATLRGDKPKPTITEKKYEIPVYTVNEEEDCLEKDEDGHLYTRDELQKIYREYESFIPKNDIYINGKRTINTESFIKVGDKLIKEADVQKDKPTLIKGEPTDAGTERFYFVDAQDDLHLVTKGYGKSQGFQPATKQDVQTKKPKETGGDEQKGTEAKKIPEKNVLAKTEPWKKRLPELKIPEDQKERGLESLNSFEEYAAADTEEKRVKILKDLVKNEYIEFNTNDPNRKTKKVYFQPQTGLPYKVFGDSAAIMTDMHNIANKYGIDVPLRADSQTRALADQSGKTNEAGIARFLEPSKENIQEYEKSVSLFKSLGGDIAKIDKINKETAEQVKKVLPENAEIISAKAIGTEAAHTKEAKADPTDVVVQYKVNGEEKQMKISAKIYTDPNSITVKNSGVAIGADYLGDPEFDKKINEIKEKYDYRDEALTADEVRERKAMMKTEWMELTGDKMIDLSKTEEGQKQLIDMWLEIHGCGKDVWTSVANKQTGEVELHPPDYYCRPTPPMHVVKNGKSLTIEMDEEGGDTVQMVLKTEKKGVKILFNHKSKH